MCRRTDDKAAVMRNGENLTEFTNSTKKLKDLQISLKCYISPCWPVTTCRLLSVSFLSEAHTAHTQCDEEQPALLS